MGNGFTVEQHGSLFVVLYEGRFVVNCESKVEADIVAGACARVLNLRDYGTAR